MKIYEKCVKLIRFSSDIVIGFFFLLLFGFITAVSFFATCDMNQNNAMQERIDFLKDNVFINIAVFLLVAVMFYFLVKLLPKIKQRTVIIIMTIFVSAFGILFLSTAFSAPTHDSYIVTNAAYLASRNDFSALEGDYFKSFPFQLGFVLFEEIFFRFFPFFSGPLFLEYINLAFLVLGYLALVDSVRMLFKNEKVTKLLAVFLCLFIQPILFTTFLYGNIPGLAFALAGFWAYLKFRQNQSVLFLILTALFNGFAVSIKLNYLIFTLSLLVLAGIQFLEKRKLKQILLIALTVISVISIKNFARWQYEYRTGEDFGDGIPMVAWAAMGAGDSGIAPGWYNGESTVATFYATGKDSEKTGELAAEKLKSRLEYFGENPKEGAVFYYQKFTSMWNEPTAQSIWNTSVRGQYLDRVFLAKYICGSGEAPTKIYMEHLSQFLFVFALLSFFFLRKEKDIMTRFFYVSIIGGMLYHLLCEAKSQYTLPYLVLMLPLAAYGAVKFFEFIDKKAPFQKLTRKKI